MKWVQTTDQSKFPTSYQDAPTSQICLTTKITLKNTSYSTQTLYAQTGKDDTWPIYWLRIGILDPFSSGEERIYPLGCINYEIFPETKQFIIRHIEDESEKLGIPCSHVGSALLEIALREKLAMKQGLRIRLSSLHNAVLFYHKWGFVPEEEALRPEIEALFSKAKEQQQRLEFNRSLWMTLPKATVCVKKRELDIPLEDDSEFEWVEEKKPLNEPPYEHSCHEEKSNDVRMKPVAEDSSQPTTFTHPCPENLTQSTGSMQSSSQEDTRSKVSNNLTNGFFKPKTHCSLGTKAVALGAVAALGLYALSCV